MADSNSSNVKWFIGMAVPLMLSLASLIWFAASQNGKLERLLEQQAEMKQQQTTRELRDETYRTNQSTAIAEIRLNDSRQDLRLENLEKAVRVQAMPLGRWTK